MNFLTHLTLLILLLLGPGIARADGVVSDCTQEELEALVGEGGLVFFEDDCSITLTNTIVVTNQVVLDSDGFDVTLSGGSQVRIFSVQQGGSLTLNGITLTRGRGTNDGGGAIYITDGGEVITSNCVFSLNVQSASSGLDGKDGKNQIGTGNDGGNGQNGQAGLGGVVYNLGYFAAYQCQFTTNGATGGNGGNAGNGGAGDFTGGDGGDGGNGGVALGGAVYSTGSLLISGCSFTGNEVGAGHAGIGGDGGVGSYPGYPGSGGSGGDAKGGAIYAASLDTQVINSTFEGNNAFGGNSADGGMLPNRFGADGPRGGHGIGGAVYSEGSLAMTNCTVYGNWAIGGNGGNGGPGQFSGGDGGNGGNGLGGGVTGTGEKITVNCTFLENAAGGGTNGLAGAGAFSGEDGKPGASRGGNVANSEGQFTLVNTILGTNSNGKVGHGTFIDGGHNISADKSISLGPTSLVATNPGLGSIGNHGGFTRTIPLVTNSPAIDAANDAVAPEFDQRGLPRPAGLHSDIGAIENGFTISGRVTLGTSGLAGVLISIDEDRFTETDAAGHFRLPASSETVVLTPTLSSYTFSPSSVSVAVTGNVSGVSFSATRLFAVSGRVLESTNPVRGVTVLVGTNVATTSLSGNYSVNVPPGAYTIVPSLACYRFDPTNRAIIVTSTSTNRADFAAISESYHVAGRVTLDGTGLAGVSINIDGVSTQTDTNGNFLASNACAGTYTVTPSLTGYTFEPLSVPITLTTNISGVNFAAFRAFAVSGRITEGAFPLDGVIVKAVSDSGSSQSAVSTNGVYAFTALKSNVTYTLTPVLSGYRFEPPSISLTLVTNINGADFTAAQPPIISALATNGQIELSFSGLTGRVYVLEASTNLLSWVPVTTNASSIHFTDSQVTNVPARFYRLRATE